MHGCDVMSNIIYDQPQPSLPPSSIELCTLVLFGALYSNAGLRGIIGILRALHATMPLEADIFAAQAARPGGRSLSTIELEPKAKHKCSEPYTTKSAYVIGEAAVSCGCASR